MTHELQFPNGVLEYIVHVIQSKSTLQSHFKITRALYLFVSDTMERMDSQNYRSLFILIRCPCILKLSTSKTVLKYSFRPRPGNSLSSLPLDQEDQEYVFPKGRGVGEAEIIREVKNGNIHKLIILVLIPSKRK